MYIFFTRKNVSDVVHFLAQLDAMSQSVEKNTDFNKLLNGMDSKHKDIAEEFFERRDYYFRKYSATDRVK